MPKLSLQEVADALDDEPEDDDDYTVPGDFHECVHESPHVICMRVCRDCGHTCSDHMNTFLSERRQEADNDVRDTDCYMCDCSGFRDRGLGLRAMAKSIEEHRRR